MFSEMVYSSIWLPAVTTFVQFSLFLLFLVSSVRFLPTFDCFFLIRRSVPVDLTFCLFGTDSAAEGPSLFFHPPPFLLPFVLSLLGSGLLSESDAVLASDDPSLCDYPFVSAFGLLRTLDDRILRFAFM